MRTTVTLDEELLARATQALGVEERSVVLHEGLKLIVERAAARRLALLGGSDPTASMPARKRPDAAAPGRRTKSVK